MYIEILLCFIVLVLVWYGVKYYYRDTADDEPVLEEPLLFYDEL